MEPVVTILISYDKFTQCNKDLSEHQFADCALHWVTTLRWPNSELKQKKPTGKASGK